MSAKSKKIVVVGDSICGKNALIITFMTNEFPKTWVPTVIENYSKTITIDEKQIELNIVATNGIEDYDRLRPLAYPHTDVFLLCFAVNSPLSLENALQRWYPEVKSFCPDAAIVLVGNKSDLRTDSHTIVTFDQGKLLADRIGAFAYLECSAMKNEGVGEVFETLARASLPKKKKKNKCRII